MGPAPRVMNLLQTILYITPTANPRAGRSTLPIAWQRKLSPEHPLDVLLRIQNGAAVRPEL